MIEKIKKNWFTISIVSIIAIYMILVSVQNPKFIYFAGYDDLYILNLAESFLNLDWLGLYNSVTLTKGIFSSLFIAFSNFLGIPLLIGQSIFYVGACSLLVYTLKNIIKNKFFCVLLFIIILFNPIMYSDSLLRIYRDNIYSSLLIYLVACAFGIFFNYKEKPKNIVGYMFGFGFSLTAMAICREESIWIAPFVLGSSIITILFIIFDKQVSDKFKKISLYIIPIVIYTATIIVICFMNYRCFGEFIRNEFSSLPWKNFLKAASSVDVEKTYLTVPLTKEARQKIYEVSPSFKELEPYFEGDSGNGWAEHGDIPNEIEGGWFQWAMVGAMDGLGYCKDAKTENDFLRKITNEINAAYDDGRLKKEDNPETIFSKDNFDLFLNNINKAFKFQLNLDELYVRLDVDNEPKDNKDLSLEQVDTWRELTGHISTNTKTYNYKVDKLKIDILQKVADIYQKFNHILFYIALILFIVEIIRFFVIKPRFENYKYIIVLLSLLMMFIIRIIVIAYTSTALFHATNIMYLSSTYSMQFAFEILAIIFVISDIKMIIDRKTVKEG